MAQQSAPSVEYVTPEELEAGLASILGAPRDDGVLQLIVRRPGVEEREVVEEAQLDLEDGLVGDNWRARGRSKGRRPPNPKAQITVTGARMTALVARTPERWPLAGDQLYVDLDLSGENVPPGTRLQVGLGGDRGHRRAAHRLREVPGAVRHRSARVREHAPGARAQPPRDQRTGRRAQERSAPATRCGSSSAQPPGSVSSAAPRAGRTPRRCRGRA